MEKGSAPNWRQPILDRLDLVLVIFDLVLSLIFILVSYLSGSIYLRGVGVGLLIAGVTAGVALLAKKRFGQS